MSFKREIIKYLCNRMNKSKKEIKKLTEFRKYCFTFNDVIYSQYYVDFIYNYKTLTLTKYNTIPTEVRVDIKPSIYYEVTKVGDDTDFYGEHYIHICHSGKTIESCCNYLFER